jgi:hypothetical protein
MSCPLVSCNERGPHQHPACETCGAVDWGNIFCGACLRWHKRAGRGGAEHLAFLRVLIKIADRRARGEVPVLP